MKCISTIYFLVLSEFQCPQLELLFRSNAHPLSHLQDYCFNLTKILSLLRGRQRNKKKNQAILQMPWHIHSLAPSYSLREKNTCFVFIYRLIYAHGMDVIRDSAFSCGLPETGTQSIHGLCFHPNWLIKMLVRFRTGTCFRRGLEREHSLWGLGDPQQQADMTWITSNENLNLPSQKFYAFF